MKQIDKWVAEDDELWGCVVAAGFAQRLKLPAGNLWECGIAKSLAYAAKEIGRKMAYDQLYMSLFGGENEQQETHEKTKVRG